MEGVSAPVKDYLPDPYRRTIAHAAMERLVRAEVSIQMPRHWLDYAVDAFQLYTGSNPLDFAADPEGVSFRLFLKSVARFDHNPHPPELDEEDYPTREFSWGGVTTGESLGALWSLRVKAWDRFYARYPQFLEWALEPASLTPREGNDVLDDHASHADPRLTLDNMVRDEEERRLLESFHSRRLGLGYAGLWNAHLPGVDLGGAYLAEAELQRANLDRAMLSCAWMVGARLRDTQLFAADLSHAWLNLTDMRGARLRAANLRNAVLSGADLRGADFFGATLAGANIARVKIDAATKLTRLQIQTAEDHGGVLTEWDDLHPRGTGGGSPPGSGVGSGGGLRLAPAAVSGGVLMTMGAAALPVPVIPVPPL